MTGGFLQGAFAPFRALGMLRRERALRRLAFRPLLINVVVYVVGLPVAIWGAWSLSGSIIGEQDGAMGVLRVLLQIIVVATVIVGGALLFVVLGNIIAGPYNSRLSEEVERLVRGDVTSDDTGIVIGAVRSIGTSLGRLVLYIAVYPFIFVIQFVPIIGPFLHLILAILYLSFVLAFDLSDPTLERHITGFTARVRYVLRHPARHVGFGLVAGGMALLPFVNLLVLPVCVTGGALLFVQNRNQIHAKGAGAELMG